MGKYCVLFNPYASNGQGEEKAKDLVNYLPAEECDFINMAEISDYQPIFDKLSPDDKIVVCGGDGTLNCLINDCDDKFPENEIYLFPTGTGNDFLNDLNKKPPCAPLLISQYLKDLPCVEINDKKHYFIDNVAYGIDGWVCEVADQQKENDPNANINYTKIAISGLLGKYKPCNAKVVVDGKEYTFKNVWMAPTMNGRFYGGGMMVTPMQDRLDDKREITLMLFHRGNRMQIAVAFPGVFKGTHINNKNAVFIKGHDITVEFDSPRAVQIDGETILGVTKYHAYKK